jgi:hypothetical protein
MNFDCLLSNRKRGPFSHGEKCGLPDPNMKNICRHLHLNGGTVLVVQSPLAFVAVILWDFKQLHA